MLYRKEFDGLRAIAVIAVIIYHINNHYLPHGFLGVDIFLVLSGFLITSIITGSLKQEQFELFRFLKKRFFRIYPAYFTVICLTLIGAFMLLPTAAARLIQHASLYSFLGLPNVFYYRNISESYFELNATYPLLHLWSLGLELQFYLVWSLILTGAHKLKINLGYLIGFLTLASFACATYFYTYPTSMMVYGHEFLLGKKFVFYLLPPRIWEFGIGALASIYAQNFKHEGINQLLSLAGLMLLVIALGFFQQSQEYSPYIALLPCLGTFLFMTCCKQQSFASKILSSKVLVAIGLGSYSLYLWHFPLIEFFKYFYQPYNLALQCVSIISMVVLALCSYTFIESYYRHTQTAFNFPKYCASFACLVLLTYTINKSELNSDFYKFTQEFPGSCLYHPGDAGINNFDTKTCTVGKDLYKPKVLVVGSSHTNSFVPFLSVFAKKYGFSFVNITANSTGYTKEYLIDKKFQNDPQRIKLHETFYNLVSSMESDYDVLITCPSWAYSEPMIFAKTLQGWSHKFKMVILIDHIPSPERFTLNRRFLQQEINFTARTDSSLLETEAKKYHNVFFISLNQLILENKGMDDKRHALLFDKGHLNIGGSKYLASKVIQKEQSSILKSSEFLNLAKSIA